MNGLLDFDDPKTLGMLTMGLGLLGSRGRFGEALGQAGLQGISAMQQASDRRAKKQVQDFQLRQMTREEAAAKKKEADEQAMLEAARASFTPGFAGSPGTQMVNDALPPELQIGAQAPIPARPSGFDQRAFIDRMRMINPLEALKLEQSFKKETPFNKVDPKDYTTESVAKFAQTGNYGDLIPARKMEVAEGQVYDPYNVKPGTRMNRPQLVDTGAGFMFVTPEAGMQIPKSMSPAERDASARGWAANRIANENLGLARQRFDFEKTKPDDKPLTDAQAKAALFGVRMQESDRVLNDLAQQGVTRPGFIKRASEATASLVPFAGDKITPLVGAGANWTQSANQQMVEQAQRDFINAVLRRESGAVISPSEFANAEQQYFPQTGDDEKTLQRKAANRQVAIRGILAEVPQNQRGRIVGEISGRQPPAATSDPLGLR